MFWDGKIPCSIMSVSPHAGQSVVPKEDEKYPPGSFIFFPNIQIAGQVPASIGNLALTSTRPYLNANLEFNRAEVYCFVIP